MKNQRFKFFILAIIAVLILACVQPESNEEVGDIQVSKTNESEKIQGNIEEFPLPNCGGNSELAFTLGTQTSVKKTVTIGATATLRGGGEAAISTFVKGKLEAEVSAAYDETFQSESTRLDSILFKAAPVTRVVYVVQWVIEEYSSTVSYSLDGKIYDTNYVYSLQVPKLSDSYSTKCSNTPSSENLQPLQKIKVVTQSPLSGGQSGFGIDLKRGAELALEQLGNPLAQMGYQVELVPYDDQANPEVGVINAKQIVADQEVLCGVGHFNSGVMIPSSEEYHNARLPFVSPANTNPTVTDRGYLEVNRIVGRDDVQSMVAAEFANRHGINSIFVIHDNTVYGEGVSNRFIEQSVKLGIDVVEVVGTEEKSDFSLVSSSILAKSPDAVFFAGLYSQAGVFFRQVRDSGFTGIFLGTDGMDSSELATIAGDALVTGGGLFYTTVSGPPVIYPDAAAFINDFRAHYGSNPQPFAAQAYDAMAVCLKAIENSAVSKGGGLPTREEVAIAIRSLKDFKGITGIMNFNGNGDLTTARYFIIKVTSSDPARWYDNEIYQSFDISPP